MFRNEGIIYVLDQKIRGRDMFERLARTRQELMKFGCRELDEEVRETYPTSRKDMLSLLKRYSRMENADPIIAVSSWAEVRHPDVARELINGGFSVIIASRAKDFEQSKETDTRIVGRGPVLHHIIDVQSSLRAYLRGLEATKGSKLNDARKNEAREFAEKLWPHIVEAVETVGTTNREDVSAQLNKAGCKSRKGFPISASTLKRYATQAGKELEWDELLKQYEKN